jgi:hypothetical protein
MVTRLCVALLVLFAASGCVEERKPASATKPASSSPATEAPAKEAPTSGEIVHDYAKNLSTALPRAAALIDIASIQRAINQFQAMEGRNPKSLEELVAMRYLPQLPPVPQGKRLSYDAVTAKVELVAQ